MTHKNAPDVVLQEVEKLRGLCGAESEARIRQQGVEMERRFHSMFEETEEKIEQCEQAMAGMQQLLKDVKKFEEWVGQVEAGLAKRKEVKRPIGTLQTEIDEHYVSLENKSRVDKGGSSSDCGSRVMFKLSFKGCPCTNICMSNASSGTTITYVHIPVCISGCTCTCICSGVSV